MKGTILGLGIISGEDGKRYSFSLKDIQNLTSQYESSLANCEVDFEVEGSNAKAIFITKSSPSAGCVAEAFGKDDLNSIKTKAYVYIGLTLLGFIPVGFIFLIMAIISLSRISGVVLLRNLIWALVCYFVGGIVIFFGLLLLGANGSVGFLVSVIGFVLCVVGLIFDFSYYKGLTTATNEGLFFYAFICRAIAILTLWTIIVGIIFIFIELIVELVAWIKFKEVKKVRS